ncbi:MAG: hypothetical protein IKT40_09015 [Bacilli bacterium]|nr:hypothetical protein [Bacilli bacterium]
MEIANNVLVIKVEYKNRWGVFPSEDGSIKVCKSDDVENLYFYYGDYLTLNIDEVFDLIEETIEMNISAELKIQLLTEKIEELKQLFTTESLERLQNLYFDFKEVKKTPKKRNSKKNKNETEEVVQVVEETESVELELNEVEA